MWEPGRRYEYHHTSAHWLMGRDRRAADGQRLPRPTSAANASRYRRVSRISNWAFPIEHHGRVADVEFVQPPPEDSGGEVTAETTIHFNYPQQRRGGAARWWRLHDGG